MLHTIDRSAAVADPLATALASEEMVDSVSERLESLALSPRCPSRKRPSWTRFKRPIDWLEGMPRAGFVYDEAMLEHNLPGHVEKPGRTLVPYQRLQREGILQRCFRLESRLACSSEIALFHTSEHISNVQKGNVDTKRDLYWMESATNRSALFSVGCTLQAMEAVLHGALDNAFALVRPPGHHAEKSAAQGFCFFNNVAIAALKARDALLRSCRILILDWDVHHGNGTQNCFYDDPCVLYISIHRGGDFYPGTGEISEIGKGKGFGYNVNIPWPGAGFGDADYLAAFDSIVEPLVTAFEPDLTLVSAGFDAVVHDPLGGLAVTPSCFALMTQQLLRLNPKTVLVLEGGYNLLQVSACVDQCTRVLLGDVPKPLTGKLNMKPETVGILKQVSENLSIVWPILSALNFDKKIEQFQKRVLCL